MLDDSPTSSPRDFQSVHVTIARLTAPWFFAIAMLFLVCQAVLIVMWVDVPNLQESASATSPDQFVAPASSTSLGMRFESIAIGLMAILWPWVIGESIYHWIIRPKTWPMRWFHFYSFVFCICPSLRMCARSVEMDGLLWLPGLGWQRGNKRLRRRLSQHFSIPMIGIALLILPVLIVEFLLRDQVAQHQWLRILLHCGTGVIWFAFAAEFILMVSIAEKKLLYVRKHWVDLAIILLPFFSFLRSLQALRGTKLAKLAKIPQLAKLARAYRLRGTALKGFQALMVLGVASRLLRVDPERQLTRLRSELEVARREIRLIRLGIARLEREIAEAAEAEKTTSDQASVPAGDIDSGDNLDTIAKNAET